MKKKNNIGGSGDLFFLGPNSHSIKKTALNYHVLMGFYAFYIRSHFGTQCHSDKTHTCTNMHTQTKTTRIPYCLLFFMTSQMGYQPVDGLTDGDAKTHLKMSAVMSVLMSSFRIFWRNCLKGT